MAHPTDRTPGSGEAGSAGETLAGRGGPQSGEIGSAGSTLAGQTGGVINGGGESEQSSQHFGQQQTTSGYGMQPRAAASGTDVAAGGTSPGAPRGWDSESGYDAGAPSGHGWAHHGVQAAVSGDDEMDADFRRWREEKMAELERNYRLWRQDRARRSANEFAGLEEFERWREGIAAARGHDTALGSSPVTGSGTPSAPGADNPPGETAASRSPGDPPPRGL